MHPSALILAAAMLGDCGPPGDPTLVGEQPPEVATRARTRCPALHNDEIISPYAWTLERIAPPQRTICDLRFYAPGTLVYSDPWSTRFSETVLRIFHQR